MNNSPSSMSAAAIHRHIETYQTTAPLPMLIRLDIALRQAEATEALGKRIDNGDIWFKGWKRAMDLREQIAMLKNLTGAQ